jgi:hypothetical protein
MSEFETMVKTLGANTVMGANEARREMLKKSDVAKAYKDCSEKDFLGVSEYLNGVGLKVRNLNNKQLELIRVLAVRGLNSGG